LAFDGIPALTGRVFHLFAYSEIDDAVAAIFNASHKVKKFYSDVTERSPKATPATDIYVNTSPCQPFSMMGSGELFEIANTLPFDFII
jgi:site-specific DNA-cytosine methylase